MYLLSFSSSLPLIPKILSNLFLSPCNDSFFKISFASPSLSELILGKIGFEKFNLKKSLELEIPIIATNEVFYLDKDMHEAHDALICIGNKTYVNEKNRIKLSNQHYFKTNSEMTELFADLPEALENNYNFPLRCNFRPLFSNPILPNISSEEGGNADDILKKDSLHGLRIKFDKIFGIKSNELENNGLKLHLKGKL